MDQTLLRCNEQQQCERLVSIRTKCEDNLSINMTNVTCELEWNELSCRAIVLTFHKSEQHQSKQNRHCEKRELDHISRHCNGVLVNYKLWWSWNGINNIGLKCCWKWNISYLNVGSGSHTTIFDIKFCLLLLLATRPLIFGMVEWIHWSNILFQFHHDKYKNWELFPLKNLRKYY